MTILSIVIGVMIMFGLNGIAPAMKEVFISNTQSVALSEVDLHVTRQDGSFFRQEYEGNVGAVPGVESTAAMVLQAVNLPPDHYFTPDGNDVSSIQVYGIDTSITDETYNVVTAAGRRVISGRNLQPGDTGQLVLISEQFDRPVFIEKYPAKIKAFYMQPDPDRPEVALCADLLAPGFGEIIGGSQRIHDEDLLRQRLEEHGLPVEDYRWYLDLRRYGSVPHSGFGLGIERTVLWISGLPHIREAIPFPRMLYRIYP